MIINVNSTLLIDFYRSKAIRISLLTVIFTSRFRFGRWRGITERDRFESRSLSDRPFASNDGLEWCEQALLERKQINVTGRCTHTHLILHVWLRVSLRVSSEKIDRASPYFLPSELEGEFHFSIDKKMFCLRIRNEWKRKEKYFLIRIERISQRNVYVKMNLPGYK